MRTHDRQTTTSCGRNVKMHQITSADAGSVRLFFQELAGDSETVSVFHPHLFTPEQAVKIAHYNGLDYYAAVLLDDRMVGYGMLRGWDEGYEIPSLGLVISASFRGLGLGHLMMNYLHTVVRLRGAKTIMLKVYKENETAARLYRQMGYVLSDLNEREWKGLCEIGAAHRGCECDRKGCK